MRDDILFLRHILKCIGRIEQDVAEGRESFMGSHTLQDAVLRNLQVIAESTQHLSEKVKSAHLEIEWQRIGAFRNVLVHNYLGIDIERIWDIIRRDVPELKKAISTMLGDSQD